MIRPIGTREMGLVFEVVDELGLSRETIWLGELRRELAALG